MLSTLYDHWLERRRQLESGATTSIHAPVLAKILHHLLERYRGQPEAALAAPGPTTATPFWANERLIVINHYLGQGKVGGVKSEAQAFARVSGVLARMTSPPIGPPEQDAECESHISDGPPNAVARLLQSFQQGQGGQQEWQRLSLAVRWAIAQRDSAFSREDVPFDAISECLLRFHVLPREGVAFLGECAGDTDSTPPCPERASAAAELLARCENRSALSHVLSAWRHRLEKGCIDKPLGILEKYYLAHPGSSAEILRNELGSTIAMIRMRAAVGVGEIGTLADIPLLSDLLVVPETADEHPGERDELTHAIERIAERFPPRGAASSSAD